MISRVNAQRLAFGMIAFFGLIFCSISLVNHYLFRTYGLDLGMANNALWCYAHLKANYFIVTPWPTGTTFLGDHFTPVIMLFVPFYYLFGSYALLIVQIAAIIIGGIGVYKYCQLDTDNPLMPLLVMLHYFVLWGLYSALAYDYHGPVIGDMAVPWFILFVLKRKWLWVILTCLLILISRETFGFWIPFILLGIAFGDYGLFTSNKVKFISIAILSFIYSIVVITIIMPRLSGTGELEQLKRFSYLGSNFSEMIQTIFSQPLFILKMIFTEAGNPDIGYNGKYVFYFGLMISGGVCLLLKPRWLLMLLPVFFFKLVASDSNMWGVTGHYSIEFMPVLSIALFDFTRTFKKDAYKIIPIIIFIAGAIFFTRCRMEHYDDFERINFYSSAHYIPQIQVGEIYQKLSFIPDSSSLSVSSEIAPHVALRERIYHFPVVRDARYILVILKNRSTYPLSKEEYLAAISKYQNSPSWQSLYHSETLLILKRRK